MESEIQLKESGIPLTIGIRNHSSTEKESVIPRRGIQNARMSQLDSTIAPLNHRLSSI